MLDLVISAAAPAEADWLVHEIEAELLDALAEANPQAVNADLVLRAAEAGGDLAGGVTGATSYGWLLVKMLWVRKDLRSQGLGGRLLAAAEAEARHLGCHAAWLETSNAAARGFYLTQGYAVFGELANAAAEAPPGHTRWFLQKRL